MCSSLFATCKTHHTQRDFRNVEFTNNLEFSTARSFSQLPPTSTCTWWAPHLIFSSLIPFHLSLSSSTSTRQRRNWKGQRAPWREGWRGRAPRREGRPWDRRRRSAPSATIGRGSDVPSRAPDKLTAGGSASAVPQTSSSADPGELHGDFFLFSDIFLNFISF